MPKNQPNEDEIKANSAIIERSRERYLKFFMLDFIELSIRKVTSQNTVFCANHAKLFDRLMDD